MDMNEYDVLHLKNRETLGPGGEFNKAGVPLFQ